FGAEARVLDRDQLLSDHPFLTEDSAAGLVVPRAGWFRAQDLGQWMLDRIRDSGGRLLVHSVVGLRPGEVDLSDGTTISTGDVVIAAGPLSGEVGAMAGLDLPLSSELHLKVAFRDHRAVIPRTAPMTIWSDTQTLSWNEEEREELASMGRTDLLGEMPVFCHFRPEGGPDSPYVVALWEYHGKVMEPTWPLPEDPLYPEVVMRGLTTMVPGLSVYLEGLPESFVDGGYYTKTAENRPLIGPSGAPGLHLMTGMSGFGVMVSAGAGDLLARHIADAELPAYSDAFLLGRYEDGDYVAAMGSAASGQL
ncbi:MAG: FAD-binding oxidoreductase, partial [Acidimicrobiia bacterium]